MALTSKRAENPNTHSLPDTFIFVVRLTGALPTWSALIVMGGRMIEPPLLSNSYQTITYKIGADLYSIDL